MKKTGMSKGSAVSILILEISLSLYSIYRNSSIQSPNPIESAWTRNPHVLMYAHCDERTKRSYHGKSTVVRTLYIL